MALSTNNHLIAQLPALRQVTLGAMASYDLAVTQLKLLAMEIIPFFG